MSVVPGTVVSAKVAPPPISGRELARPRLDLALDRFGGGPDDGATEPSVAAIIAPPGFGKTTLAVSFARRVGAQSAATVAWATFDSSDGGRSALTTVVRAAVMRAGIDLSSPGGPPPHRDDFGPLCQAIAAHPDPVVLVLDDVHEVTDRDALADLDRLVR